MVFVRFSDLIVSGLAEARLVSWAGDPTSEGFPMIVVPPRDLAKSVYHMKLTDRGKALVQAWKKGDLRNLQNVVSQVEETTEEDS